LPLALAILAKPATLADVRDGLEVPLRLIARTERELSKLAQGRSGSAKWEVLQRVQIADFQEWKASLKHTRATRTDTIAGAIESLSKLRAVLERARNELPREQRRHRTASPSPVALLDEALLRGFVLAHESGRTPRYTVKRSSTPNSPYRRIIEICYVAMGRSNTDPEQAVKAFIKQRRGRVVAKG
jgi:hypothetical protein